MAASNHTGDEVLQAALGLPKRERMRIARNLLESIEDEAEADEGWEDAWRVEIERRLAEVSAGRVKLENPATVLKELRSELAGRRKKKRPAARAATKKRRARAR
jgi:putative addiction module component (TIGR02574 family)